VPQLRDFVREITESFEKTYPVRIPRAKALSVLSKMWPSIDARVVFEGWENDLRKPIASGRWSVFYSVYSDSLVVDILPDWGQIERAADIRRTNLEKELESTVTSLSSSEFALFLANLFSRVDWASDVRVTKQSRDGGVDFQGYYIYHDKGKVPLFGQAKHWSAKIGSELIRTFIGSVMTRAAGKACVGLYAGTGGFTPDAEKEITNSPFRLLSYDLKSLVKLMIESNVGVRNVRVEGSKIDGSFWDEISP
jgi:restriction endonuclease Mrr